MEAEKKPIAVLQVDSQEYPFFSRKELRDLISNEYKFAESMSVNDDYKTVLSTALNRVSGALEDPEGYEERIQVAIKQLEQDVKERNLVLSFSPLGILIGGLEPAEKQHAVSYLQNPKHNQHIRIGAIAKLVLLREQERLLPQTILKRVEEVRKQTVEVHRDMETVLGTAKNALEQQLKDSTSDIESRQALYESIRQRLLELETLYREKLHLQAPVEYWTQRSDFYTKQAHTSIRYFLLACFLPVAAILSVWGLWIYPKLESIQTPQLYVLSLPLLFLSAIAFFIIRGSYKLMMSNYHLAGDASEKATMAQTFLALLGEKDVAMSKEDRAFLLQAIFRNSVTGLVGNEEPPNTLSGFAEVVKMFKG